MRLGIKTTPCLCYSTYVDLDEVNGTVVVVVVVLLIILGTILPYSNNSSVRGSILLHKKQNLIWNLQEYGRGLLLLCAILVV